MLAPTKNARKRPKIAPNLNASSKTKTSQKDRKKEKKKLSLDMVRKKVTELAGTDELLLLNIFSDAKIESLLNEIHGKNASKRRDRVYTPQVTLSLFVQQVLSKDAGCKEMVTLLNKQRKAQRRSAVSTNTTSYCHARLRIPLELIRILMQETSKQVMSKLPKNWRWKQHRVLLVDGLVIDAPDTPENQEKYPQPTSQKPGLGFPQIRNCAIICLSTGVVIDVQYGSVLGKKTGEQSLFRKMFPNILPGDVVVGDSLYDSYRDMAMLQDQGAFMVCGINGTRESPFSGPCRVIEETTKTLKRPDCDPSRFTRAEWEALPKTLDVRIIRYQVTGRNDEITIVTTLLDRKRYPAADVANLYKHRWEGELDIRSIKTVMGMESLSCHTPEMLERELLTYYLAYNVVRLAMCDAARTREMKPRDFSFKNAKDSWLHLGQDGIEVNDYAWLLWSIADSPLRKRPGRNEPRKIKRRLAKYERLKVPRAQEKAALSP